MAGETMDTQYLYPTYTENLAQTVSNYAAGLPAQIQNTYQNWYSGDLAATASPNTQQAATMAQQANPWTPQVQGAMTGLQQTYSPYMNQASNALSPWSSTIGAGLTALGSTVGAVNPYLSGTNTYQQLGQDAMTGYNTAMGTLGGAMGQVNPYMGSADVLQSQAQNYASQIGGGQAGVQSGMNALGGVNPYLQKAAGSYTAGSDYDPSQLAQYLNPYTQQAAQATVGDLTRNLQEKILPEINTTFTGAGQFGSTRNADFESRAIRDTQEAAAKALAQANYGAYNQAQQAYSDWANKQMQAGQGMAGLAGQQTNLGQAYGQLGGQQAQIASQQVASTLQNAGLDQNQAQLVAQLMPQIASGQAGITGQQVSNFLQQAGLDQSQANLVAQMYPQLASSYSNLGQQYGALSGAYGNLGTNQINYANAMANLAGAGATLDQQQFSNLLTTGKTMEGLQQNAYDKYYQDWLAQQQYPTTQIGALAKAAGSMADITKPDVDVTQMTTATDAQKIALAIDAISKGLDDQSIQSLLGSWFNTGA